LIDVKTRICIAIVLTLLVLPGLALAQEEATEAKPWEAWEPPDVEMPDPNAWNLYLQAFALHDRVRAGREVEAPDAPDEPVAGEEPVEAPAPAGEPAGEPAPAMPPPEVGAGARLPNVDFGWAHELEIERLAELVDAYSPVFRTLEAAIAGETQAPPLRTYQDTEEFFPLFAQFRQAARMFAGRSRLHREEGRPLEAALDAIACLHLGTDVGTQRSLIAGLVQTACQAIGEAQLRQVIPLLDATEARIAGNAMRRAMAETASLAETMAGEAAFAKAFFIETLAPAMGDAQRLEELYGDAEFARAAAGVSAEQMWEQMLPFHEQRTELAARPYWARGALSAPDNPLLERQIDILERTGLKFAFMEARLRVDLAALAAQAYRGEHGAYPAGLDALAPDYLPEVPRDPFADAALRSQYREPEGAKVLVIYSVGPDGDDDGSEDIGRSIKLDSDGDIALVLTAE